MSFHQRTFLIEFVLLVFVCSLLNIVFAGPTWYIVEMAANSITSFNGVMVIPRRPSGSGTYYVWPGLQPGNGILQEVCDGRTGSWWIGAGWCCGNPSLPWGAGFSVNPGDQVAFTNTQQAGGTWQCTLSKPNTPTATSSFPLPNWVMNRAVFAVELWGVPWDFGPVTYENVQVQTTSSDPGVCNFFWSGNLARVITGQRSEVNSIGALCRFDSMVMWNNAAFTLDFLNHLPTSAYSLRLLTQSYHGAAIKVRRSSDGATLDVGFVNNVLDTATLLSFIGANNGAVVTWYDQSGNGNNAVQSIASHQPLIVTNGNLVTAGGKPSVLFDGGAQSFFSLGKYPFQNGASAAAYFVNSLRTVQSWQRYFDFGSNTSVNIFASPTSPSAFRLTVHGSSAEQGPDGQLLSATNQLNMAQFHHYGATMSAHDSINEADLSSASSITVLPSSLNGVTNNYFGKSQYTSDPYFDGWMSEIILFNADPFYGNVQQQEAAFFNSIKAFYNF